jgi:hypothetical protein
MLRELEQRTLMGDLLEQDRQGREVVATEQVDVAMKALGRALLGVERAFAIGSLTIVDAPCWEAMGAGYVRFLQLRAAMDPAPVVHSPEEVEHYVGTIQGLAAQFNAGVGALVRAATDRVSPAETLGNPRRRRAARRRLTERFKEPPASPWPTDQDQQQR